MPIRLLLAGCFLLFGCPMRNTASPEQLTLFLDAVRNERPFGEASARAERARGGGVEMGVRSVEMPTGHREWITASFFGSPRELERLLLAQLGPARGRGFGGEPGWLLPHGAIILEKFAERIDITFAPGDPLDCLEDLDKPHLPAPFGDGVRVRSPAECANLGGAEARAAYEAAAPCAARGNYFAIRDEGGVTVWRRPHAQWNPELLMMCTAPKRGR